MTVIKEFRRWIQTTRLLASRPTPSKLSPITAETADGTDFFCVKSATRACWADYSIAELDYDLRFHAQHGDRVPLAKTRALVKRGRGNWQGWPVAHLVIVAVYELVPFSLPIWR